MILLEEIYGAPFDKNSLWGELNIAKRELWGKRILAQDLVVVWGPFAQGFGGLGG
jgi:hypothetical protein